MEREVRMSEVFVSSSPDDVLSAVGVGSCLLIALYDPRARVAALAHAVLPRAGEEGPREGRRDTRFVDSAIEEMLDRLAALGSRRGLEAKLVGGANMFPCLRDETGRDNVARARERLESAGIPIVGEAVGGSMGRSAQLSVGTGTMTVRIKL